MKIVKKLIFDEAHTGSQGLDNRGPDGLYELKVWLAKAGYTVDAAKDSVSDKLKDASALCVPFPVKDLRPLEQKAILSFVNKGGGLLLTAEFGDFYGNVTRLNEIIKNFGMKFSTDCVTDHKDSFIQHAKLEDRGGAAPAAGEGIRIPQFVIIKKFGAHPITKGVKEIGYFAGCSIDSPESCALAMSGAKSFGDMNLNAKLDDGEESGPAAVACAAAYGDGRVVCIGDTSILTNKYINYKDNQLFVTNAFRWLAKDA